MTIPTRDPYSRASLPPDGAFSRLRGVSALLAAFIAIALVLCAAPAYAQPRGDRIGVADLASGDWIESPSHAYRLVMQGDGNLVLYGPAGALWATYTSAPENSGAYLANQGDGNLVIYRPDRSVVWASRSHAAGGGTLIMQNDGNVVNYGAAGPFWSTYTNGGVSKMAASGAVAFARRQVGKPYVWGGNGPDAYDCSGLTSRAYASVGVSLHRTSQSQYLQGQAVARAALQPGDLVFYSGAQPGHVGIYVGNDEIINARNTQLGIIYNHITAPGSITGYRRYA
ncbi:NlpC/P60 family protein [Nonomuraea sp. MCN248]|uniref:NlpC/P60 family protein n=1 Tax=Nonomuraea corallina TaxID=2989783 RepID=A0ABT4SAI6_9ACTN|nr:NlpC/P60 family protein [Nonomuraea corallina]MDA0633956.1 NlpC/P60 family protein [Nonomuraea corallina]